MASPLYMVRLALEQRRLMQLARRNRLPPHHLDTGYLVHCALTELFGNLAPKPFAIPGEQQPGTTIGRQLPVLAYSAVDRSRLEDQARLHASPEVYEACDWTTLATKPMPSSWTAGRRLSFELRACPVKRKASAGAHHKEGAEVDIFLDRCWAVGDRNVPVDRAEVYLQWLRERLAASGASMLQGKLVRFQRKRLLRRDHQEQRKSHSVERPDAVFEGLLEVTDPVLFPELLARGVGRHRTFGFGMLLVKPG
ncbi:MAG: type I-E CRISPR-associated protein Cas6/Cse3/CasE [Myxococcales bacterium]|nr:type I-E CRISPR-associated protein Cas6/Cse3/CasE [Polyangiaceae bacterium]MDW8251108.1 type I-E CRISPR-associated protein Cas6/Cse3/CasE [Myxococcales bacterium]